MNFFRKKNTRIKLLNIELKKQTNNKAFWVLFILYCIVILSVFVGTQEFINGITTNSKKGGIPIPKISLYSFPYIWHNLGFIAGYFKIFLALIVIISITNEFSFKTIRQNIICGLSKWDFLSSKISLIFLLSLVSTFLFLVTGIILGLINTPSESYTLIFNDYQYILVYFLELFSFMIFALFCSFLIKKSGLTISLVLLYAYIIEPIAAVKFPKVVANFLPVNSISNLIQIPNSSLMKIFGFEFQKNVSILNVSTVIAYCGLFIWLTYYLLKKNDL